MSDERISQKIQKLLALSQSSNQHEAANALAKAQLLMEKYGLSQKSIEMSKIGSIEKEGLVRALDLPDWYKGFTSVIARCFGVRTVMHRVPGSKSREWCSSVVVFVGQKDRIELASYCYEVVGRQLLQARKEYNKQLGKMDPNRKWKLVEAYCLGFVNSLYEKVQLFVVDPQEEKLQEEKLQEMFSNLTSSRTKEKAVTREEYRAMQEGEEHGEQVSLFMPMNGQESLKIGGQK